MTDPSLDPQAARIEAIAGILNILLPLGIQAGEALVRAIQAVHGSDLTEEEISAAVTWLSEDSAIRAVLARADANGGDGA